MQPPGRVVICTTTTEYLAAAITYTNYKDSLLEVGCHEGGCAVGGRRGGGEVMEGMTGVKEFTDTDTNAFQTKLAAADMRAPPMGMGNHQGGGAGVATRVFA